MGTLIEALAASDGASAIWNEYEIVVRVVSWHDGFPPGWLVRVNDYLVASDQEGQKRGLRQQVVKDHLIASWDELAGLMSELGVPDEYQGWR